MVVPLSVGTLVSVAQERLARGFSLAECDAYGLIPVVHWTKSGVVKVRAGSGKRLLVVCRSIDDPGSEQTETTVAARATHFSQVTKSATDH
jgi:hypothetical protein